MINLIVNDLEPHFEQIKKKNIQRVFLIGGIFEDEYFVSRFIEVLSEKIQVAESHIQTTSSPQMIIINGAIQKQNREIKPRTG